MLRRLLGISLLVVLVGCNKYRPDPLEGELSYLVGIWDWDSTFHSYNWCSGGATIEETIYPIGYGSSFSIVFTEIGEVWFFANGSIIETDSVTVDHFEETGNQKHIIIHLNGDNDAIFAGRGTLSRTRFTGFPFTPFDGGCEEYKNYFSKR